MLKRLEPPVFMTNEEIDRVYEGMYALVKLQNRNDLMYYGGQVIAVADDTIEDEDALHDILDKELDFIGYTHYGHIDRGESLDVVYVTAK